MIRPERAPLGPVAAVPTFVLRYLLLLRRSPETVVLSLLQPVMFTLLFAFVLGGAIQAPGTSYVQFFLPGVLVQTVAFLGMGGTTTGLSEELRRGVVDRFSTMPAGAFALILGRTTGDLLRAGAAVLIMVGIGVLLGLRVPGGAAGAAVGIMLLLLACWVFCWLGALAALLVRSTEGAQYGVFIVLFPLTFTSSAYVPADSMPGPLGLVAAYNPITALVDAVRSCFDTGVEPGALLPAVAWLLALAAIAIPLTVRRLHHRTPHP